MMADEPGDPPRQSTATDGRTRAAGVSWSAVAGDSWERRGRSGATTKTSPCDEVIPWRRRQRAHASLANPPGFPLGKRGV